MCVWFRFGNDRKQWYGNHKHVFIDICYISETLFLFLVECKASYVRIDAIDVNNMSRKGTHYGCVCTLHDLTIIIVQTYRNRLNLWNAC